MALSLCTVLGIGRAAALDHRDADSGWSLTLPDGWRPLTDEESSDVLASAKQHSPGLQLAAAFRAGEGDFPYLLVIELPLANPSLGSLARSLRSQRVSEKIQHVARTLDQTDVQIGAPDIDERKKMVVMRSRSDTMQSLVALCPGRAVVVQLTVVFAPDASDGDLAAFEAITSSFRFDEGRGYAPKLATETSEETAWKSYLMVVVLISGFVHMARGRERRRRLREQADASRAEA